MEEKSEKPLYATLMYHIREQLDVSWVEYVYLDMVHRLSYGRWCTKSVASCAADLGITPRQAANLKRQLLEKGLFVKNDLGHLKVTKEFADLAMKKVQQPMKTLHSTYEKSSSKNNNRITIENKDGLNKILQELSKMTGTSREILLTQRRIHLLTGRLKTFKASQLAAAAQALAMDEFMQGQNENHKRYGDVDYLLRSDEIVEKYLYSDTKREVLF